MDNNKVEVDHQESPDTQPDWNSVIFGEEQVEDIEEILEMTTKVLNGTLGRPGAAEDIVAILEQHLSSQAPTQDLFEAVRDALYYNVGLDTTALMFWLAKEDNFADRMKIVERYLSLQSVQALHFVFSRHGEDLQLCLRLYRELPDDWRYIAKTIWYNETRSSHEVAFTILKQNNESFELRCPPRSILQFARVLMETLRLIPNIPEYFDKEGIDKFRSTVDGFYELLQTRADEGEEADHAMDQADKPNAMTYLLCHPGQRRAGHCELLPARPLPQRGRLRHARRHQPGPTSSGQTRPAPAQPHRHRALNRATHAIAVSAERDHQLGGSVRAY